MEDQFETAARMINEQRQPSHRAIMQRAKVVLHEHVQLLTTGDFERPYFGGHFIDVFAEDLLFTDNGDVPTWYVRFAVLDVRDTSCIDALPYIAREDNPYSINIWLPRHAHELPDAQEAGRQFAEGLMKRRFAFEPPWRGTDPLHYRQRSNAEVVRAAIRQIAQIWREQGSTAAQEHVRALDSNLGGPWRGIGEAICASLQGDVSDWGVAFEMGALRALDEQDRL